MEWGPSPEVPSNIVKSELYWVPLDLAPIPLFPLHPRDFFFFFVLRQKVIIIIIIDDGIYVELFSVLAQTHCAHVACDSD